MPFHAVQLLCSTLLFYLPQYSYCISTEVFLLKIFACICCHSKLKLWIQKNCIQNCDLFTGEYGGKFYSQHDHTITTNNKGSLMCTILQTWCACMASTFCITFNIRSVYISFNNGQSLHVIPHFFGGNTWGKIA